jgi:recombination protein RecR
MDFHATTDGPPRHAVPEAVDRLIGQLSKLPGIGRRSAERIAFHVLKASHDEAGALADAITAVKRQVRHCAVCCTLTDREVCGICDDPRRDASIVMVVEQPRDLISLEQTGMYRGVYHVLLGRLDPLDGVGPDRLTVDSLFARVEQPTRNCRGVRVGEVILGLNPDHEGDSTTLYLADELHRRGMTVSRLARGLPAGGQIEFASKAVLADALHGRQSV